LKIDNENAKQIQYLNVIRITATSFVILLHIISIYINSAVFFDTGVWWFFSILNSGTRAGVPLFFMISGYLLLNNPKTLEFATFYKKQILRVFIPFLTWDIIYFLCKIISHNEKLNLGLIYTFLKEFTNRGSYYHLWFVYSIIAVYLFAPFMKRITDSCSNKQLIWLLFVITFASTLRPFINTVTPLYIFWFDPIANGYFGYFLLGYILGKFEIGKKIRIVLYIGGIAGLLIGAIGMYILSSHERIDYTFNMGFSVNHYLSATALFLLFKNMKRLNNLKERTERIISYVSSITFGVYLIHPLIIEIFMRIVKLDNPLEKGLAVFPISLVASFLLTAILSKIKYVNKILL